MKKQEQDIVSELEYVSKTGVNLYIDGSPATPREIAGNCVKSGSVYMPDYVIDEHGVLREVRYDKISHY